MKKIFCVGLFFLIGVLSVFSSDDRFVLVIDPGHGGRDAGAVRGSYKEKSINLGVALTLGKMIESNLKNVKVVYTRKSDTFVDLYKRTAIANKAQANLFISIHTNSTGSKTTTARGADTYILGLARSEENLEVAKRENSVILMEDNYTKRYEGFDPKSPESYIIFEFMTDKYMEQSLEFATYVQRGFKNIAKRKDRGVRQAGFLVLRESAMPSVLIELGFINNPEEGRYLSTSTGQRSMASSIYTGIEKYINDFEKKGSRSSGKVSNSKPLPTIAEKGPEKGVKPIVTRETTIGKSDSNAVVPVISRGRNSADTSKRVEAPQQASPTNRGAATRGTQTLPKPQPEARSSSQGVEYRVQFLTSGKKLSAKSPQFRGLSPVKEYKEGNIYKYTYGTSSSEADALRIRKEVLTKFKDAFVIQFKNGVRVK